MPLIQVHGPPGQGPVFLAGTCGAPGGGDRDDEAEDAGTWYTTVYSTLDTSWTLLVHYSRGLPINQKLVNYRVFFFPEVYISGGTSEFI